MVPWLKAAVLVGLFYSESPPITTGIPEQCTRLSRRVYNCTTPPESNCQAQFAGFVRNEDTCTVDEFSKTFDLTGIDRLMIDDTASAAIEVHYSIFDLEVTNKAIPQPLENLELPELCTDPSSRIRYVKQNETGLWLICCKPAMYESPADISVWHHSTTVTPMAWQLLFHLRWWLPVLEMELAKVDTINGLLAIRLDMGLILQTLCNNQQFPEIPRCYDFRTTGSAATNYVFLCSEAHCVKSNRIAIQSGIQPTFEMMPAGFDQMYNEDDGTDDAFLKSIKETIIRVRGETYVPGRGIDGTWTFPAQMTFSLYDGGIWLSHVDPAGITSSPSPYASVRGRVTSCHFSCVSSTDCAALSGSASPDQITTTDVPVQYKFGASRAIVFSTACLDTEPGGCSNLMLFYPAEDSFQNSNTIEVTGKLIYGPYSSLQYDSPSFPISGEVGVDFVQRFTYSSGNPNNALACWIMLYNFECRYFDEPCTNWATLLITAEVPYKQHIIQKIEWNDLYPEVTADDSISGVGINFKYESTAKAAFDGVLETSLRSTGRRFQVAPVDIFSYGTGGYDKVNWYGLLNITQDDPRVGSLLLHTVDKNHMVLVSSQRNPGISGSIKAYYEHQVEDFVVYLVVNDTHALFGTSRGETFERATNPEQICMVRHSDEARVVRIYNDGFNLMSVESITFSYGGNVTAKTGASSATYSSDLVLLCNQDEFPGWESRSESFDMWIYKTPLPLTPAFPVSGLPPTANTIVAYNTTEQESINDVMNKEYFVQSPLEAVSELSATIHSLVFSTVLGSPSFQIFVALVESAQNTWSLVYNLATSISGDFYQEEALNGASQCSGLTLFLPSAESGTQATVLCQIDGNDTLFVLTIHNGIVHNYTQAGNTLTYATMAVRTDGLYFQLFNATTATTIRVFSETATFDHSVVGTDATTTVYFPVDAKLEFTFKGLQQRVIDANYVGRHVLDTVDSLSRIAVEPTANIQLFLPGLSGDLLSVDMTVIAPALDNPSLATFYFFDPGTHTTGTAVLTNSDGKNESLIMNLFGDGNIKWYGCPVLNLEDGVPFLTSLGTAGCSSDIVILNRFNTDGANLLTRFRLGVEFDKDVMLCWGAGNVTLGQPCGAHPVVHGSTADCGVAEGGSVDPFVCAVDGDIFSFETVQHTVTTQCISYSGTCADSDIFPPTIYSLGFSECQAQCISQVACFFFAHSNALDCQIFTRNAVADSLFFQPCPAGVLGFLCRNVNSLDILSTNVVLDPAPLQSTDPSFYTDIFQGNTVLHRIVHGMKDDASIEVDQLGDDRDFVLTFFSDGSGVTGGTVVYACGQDPPASQDHGNTTVLFSHPATEDDRFKNVTVQQCYHSTHHLTAYERMLMDAPVQSTRSCTSESAIESFYAVGFDDVSQERFQFYNTDSKPQQLDLTMQPPMPPVDKGPNFELPTYNIDFSLPYSSNNLNYGPLPGKSIKTVVAMNEPIQVEPTNEWLRLALLPTEHAPHDIRPVRLENVVKAESTSTYASNGGDTVDPGNDLKQYRITGQPNLKLSDVFWGRHNNFKAHFSQLANKASLSNETDTLAKYIFSMTEAVSTHLCPPGSHGNRCVLGRLTAPVMNPLFSDVVTVHGRKFAVGFTPYRVSPFVGIYLNGTEQSSDAMVMPDDGFIFEHGGVGYGAASTCDDNTTIYSFGGLDYGPDPKYRQFELLPFDMPAPLRWQPVWYRESVAFGCATEAETCTHDFEENVFPQGDKANLNSRFESVLHSIGHSHSKNNFYHYAAIRIIDSINPAPDSSCGTGDYTINMKLLCAHFPRRSAPAVSPHGRYDVDTHESPDLAACSDSTGSMFRLNMPLTDNNVDFSRTTPTVKQASLDEFMSPTSTQDAGKVFRPAGQLFPVLGYMQCRKVAVYLHLWPTLVSMDLFDVDKYTLLSEYAQERLADCKASRNPHIEMHLGDAGSDHYGKCYPADSGSAKILQTEIFRDDNRGDAPQPLDANQFPLKPLQQCAGLEFQSDFYADNFPSSGASIMKRGDTHIFEPFSMDSDLSQTFWSEEGATRQSFLVNLTHQAPDIFLLNRECLLGEMALVKLGAFYDDDTTTFDANAQVYQQKMTVDLYEFDLARVFSPAFFEVAFDAVHATMFMEISNRRASQNCYIKNMGDVTSHGYSYDRYCSFQPIPVPENQPSASASFAQAEKILKASWTTTTGKFKYPTRNGAEVPKNPQGQTCSVKMCVSPYPALLPPFQRNCDFLYATNQSVENGPWRECPLMPNPAWYAANIPSDGINSGPFFSKQVWRLPAFWHNKEGLWNAKAYRFDMDTYDTDPQPVDKIFKTTVHANGTATASVIGKLQCARVGAITQQSTLNPSQYYVCGGITFAQYNGGCSFCELVDVGIGKSANLDIQLDTVSTCLSTSLIVGRTITQSVSSIRFDWTCEDDSTDVPLEVPKVMALIHQARTNQRDNVLSTLFQSAVLVEQQGEPVAIPPEGLKFEDKAYTAPVSICYESGQANVRAKFTVAGSGTSITINVVGLTVTAFTNETTVIRHTLEEDFVCFDANGISHTAGPTIAFWQNKRVKDMKEVMVDLEVQTTQDARFSFSTRDRSSIILENKNETGTFAPHGIRWRAKKGYFESTEPPIAWACTYDNTGSAVCNVNTDCSTNTCISRYYDQTTTAIMDDTADNINNDRHAHTGYLTPQARIECATGSLYKAYPLNFSIVSGIFGFENCSQNLGNKSMVLIERSVEERLGMPHFIEGAPQMIVRTAEACSETSTQCHTYHESGNDPLVSTKLCFHAVGCTAEQFVDVTDSATTPPTFTCTAFEKCTENDIGKYTALGTHAGVRPQCQLVRACNVPGDYRHHTTFETNLGAIALGDCHASQPCGDNGFEFKASTALLDAQCLEFSSCSDSQYENRPPSPNLDRECLQVTNCESIGLNTSEPATPTSDAVCFNFTIECPYPNQFFSNDDGGCKDATICGVRQRIGKEKTQTTDRECIDLEACSFYEVEVPGIGFATECIPTQHASETEEIAMMAAAGTVGALACVLRIFFGPKEQELSQSNE